VGRKISRLLSFPDQRSKPILRQTTMAAAAQKALLLWGYDAPAKDTTPLDQFIEFITNPTINPPKAGEMKNVLIYWDRGTLARGDEAKMVEIGIDS
jgi:hypothetical protein